MRQLSMVIVATATVGSWVPAAQAAGVVLPTDRAVVGSRPAFTVDYPEGTLEVELAVAPDLRTQGDNVGAFVDPARTNFMLIGVMGRSPGLAEWGLSPRINAGRYFWHARPNDYATEIDRGFVPLPWGPTQVLTVRDEPIQFEGWTLRSRRVSRAPCQKRYRHAYRVSGTIAWSDNAEQPTANFVITLTSGVRMLKLRGPLGNAGMFDQVVCTNHRNARVTITLRDSAGQISPGPAKMLRFRS